MTTTEMPRAHAEEPAPAPAAKSPHLRQLDLYRVLTFAVVIFIHVLVATTYPEDVPAGAFEVPLHFARAAFFALTTFVLMFQYRSRPLQAKKFWRRRVPLVAVPYVVWSVLYWAYSMLTSPQPVGPLSGQLRALLIEIGTGTAWYHLYFLLVTLQVYLLFPLLLKLVGLIRRHPLPVLAVSGVVQIAVMVFLSYPPESLDYGVLSRFFVTLLPYQFYSVLGMVTAVHLETVHDWLRGHVRWVVAALVAGLVITETGYFLSVRHGVWPESAADAYRPYLLPWIVAAVCGLYLAGSRWAEGRQRAGRFVSWAVDRSFAVFLSHPLALALLAPLISFVGDRYGAPWTTFVIYPLTVALTFAIVTVLRRVPWSKALTGRARVRASA
ncbi:acyltransferase [Amycolatopsis jiangsuensis]|uniref:Surface polysaccharide O-acyltransferase-like enzyme n=1 Tax=Amycolatopsis jiangsuensis TaxID=1181879 RepID=A0A840IP99_9PSEU|nr:acyltransferase [Amycolatopsis jiangsuensis]MBB4683022.1 surface polysaccharide O-acyltransferase-like enzyme [Amycolatopsis jiangsuensis]